MSVVQEWRFGSAWEFLVFGIPIVSDCYQLEKGGGLVKIDWMSIFAFMYSADRHIR